MADELYSLLLSLPLSVNSFRTEANTLPAGYASYSSRFRRSSSHLAPQFEADRIDSSNYANSLVPKRGINQCFLIDGHELQCCKLIARDFLRQLS